MATIMTLRGHVARAKAFYDIDSIYFVLAHPFDWDIARITGAVKGTVTEPFVITDDTGASDHVFSFSLNGTQYDYPVDYATFQSPGKTATEVAGDLNFLVGEGVASNLDSGGLIQITSPTVLPGPSTIEVISGSDVLGFVTGETYTATSGGSDVPSPDQLIPRPNQPYGYKKVSQKNLVVPDADVAATIIGTVQGNTFDTRETSGANTLGFVVDGVVGSPVTVTFLDSATTPITGSSNAVIEAINAAAAAVNPDWSQVATIDASVSPGRIKLVSPTAGPTSSLEITDPNPAPGGSGGLGFEVQTVSGTAGGTIQYRLDQFRIVDEADIYDEGARLVHLLAEIKYDELPILPYAQIGIVTGLTLKGTVSPGKENLTPDEVDDPGILEFIDHRQLTPRDLDTKEVLELVIEF